MARPPPTTLLAFLGIVLIAGNNFVAVRFSNAGLDPFWGAALRFACASLLFYAFAAGLHTPMPNSPRAAKGVLLYGVLAFTAGYAFAYYALTEVTAGLAAVVMATVPLLTLLLAALHRVEPFRWRGLAGALVTLIGIGVIFREQVGGDVSWLHLLAMLATAVTAAETGIVVKRFPRTHPVSANALGMALGALLLLVLSLAVGERQPLPARPSTWVAVLYLVTIGSVGLFFLYRFVLDRWTASATNYQFVLTPLVAIPTGAWLAGESVTWEFLVGSAVVVGGVWVGALRRGNAPPADVPARAAAAK